MSNRLIAIGDIHGCRIALETLVQAIQPGPTDIIVTLGDYVDRGPDSRGVIDVLIKLGRKTQLVGLLGNHEEMMMAVVQGVETHHAWLRHGGVETLESYNFDGQLDFLPPAHLDFIASLGDYFEYENFFFTHAAYDPDLPLANQPVNLLRWYSLSEGVPAPHQNEKIAVVGHTANRDGEIADYGHVICLDTYCYGGGWLTAMDLRNRTIWQASQDGQLR